MNKAQAQMLFHVGLSFSLFFEMWFFWWTVIYPSAVWRKPVLIFADLFNFMLLALSILFVGIFAYLAEHPGTVQRSRPSRAKKTMEKEPEGGQKRELY